MITIVDLPNGFKVYGHADYAPHGQDIVCAGVSALAFAVVMTLQEYRQAEAEIHDGYISVHVDEYDYIAMAIEKVFWNGVEVIQKEFPQYIRIIKGEDVNDKN